MLLALNKVFQISTRKPEQDLPDHSGHPDQLKNSKYMFRRFNQTMERSSHFSKNSQDYHSSKKRKQKLLLDVAYLKCWPDNLHYYHYLHSNTSFLIIKLFYLRQINLCYYYYYYYERVIIYVTDETKLRC